MRAWARSPDLVDAYFENYEKELRERSRRTSQATTRERLLSSSVTAMAAPVRSVRGLPQARSATQARNAGVVSHHDLVSNPRLDFSLPFCYRFACHSHDMQIHILRGSEQLGPYSVEEIKASLANGQLAPTDLGWSEGMPEWAPLSTFAELTQGQTGLSIAVEPKKASSSKKPAQPSPSATRPQKKGTGLATLVMVGRILALLLVGGALVFLVKVNRSRLNSSSTSAASKKTGGAVEVAAKLKALRDAGEPVTGEELNRWYPTPPAGENGAESLISAYESIRITPQDRNNPNLPWIGKGTLPGPGLPLSATMSTAISAFLERNRGPLERMIAAAKYSRFRYPLDLSQGAGLPLPHLDQIQKAALPLAALFATSHAQLGQTSLAAQGVTALLVQARSLEMEPPLLSQFIRGWILDETCRVLETVLERVTLTPEQLLNLQQQCEQAETVDTLSRAFIAERCQYILLLQKPPGELADLLLRLGRSSATRPNPPDPSVGVSTEKNQLAEALAASQEDGNRDLIVLLDYYKDLIELSRRPLPERLDAKGECGALRERARQQATEEAAAGFLLLLTDHRQALGQVGVLDLACLRVAQGAIALERFRAAHQGTLPAALSELTPALVSHALVDPFDGRGLRYKTAGHGYTVYSVGFNRKDDGGTARARDRKDGDLVIRHP